MSDYIGIECKEEVEDDYCYDTTQFKEDLTSNTTSRGFGIIKFLDKYGSKCSLQKSSLATEDAIWLGVDDVEPKILASQAKTFGIKTDQTTGWIEYPVPEGVQLSSRMHLTQSQVKQLLPVLQKFAETGEI